MHQALAFVSLGNLKWLVDNLFILLLFFILISNKDLLISKKRQVRREYN